VREVRVSCWKFKILSHEQRSELWVAQGKTESRCAWLELDILNKLVVADTQHNCEHVHKVHDGVQDKLQDHCVVHMSKYSDGCCRVATVPVEE
jgi:hypothetical protein